MIHKQCDIEVKQVGEEDLVLEFTVSTGVEDRDGDVINPDGWQLENYRKNPVVFYGHDYRGLPVASALSIWVESNKLKSRAQFPKKEVHPFGYTVYQLCKEGFLKAASVGFRPLQSKPRGSPAKGTEFLEQELLEWSIVAIPSNPEALMEASAKGIDVSVLWNNGWTEKSGRVLSRENESNLRQAVELLQSVLSKLDSTEGDDKEFLVLDDEK